MNLCIYIQRYIDRYRYIYILTYVCIYTYMYIRIDIYVYTFILDVCFLAMHSLAKCPVGGVNSSNHVYWSECVRGCSLSRS